MPICALKEDASAKIMRTAKKCFIFISGSSSPNEFIRSNAASKRLPVTFRANGADTALIFILVESHDYFVFEHKCRRRPAVELLGQNTEIFGIGADVSFFEGDTTRNQKFLGIFASSAAGFRVEMIRHSMSR